MQAVATAMSGSPPELSLAEGKLWCDLLERRAGLHFPASQWHYLRRRLWERMRATSIATYSNYYSWVAEAGRAEEWSVLLEDLLNPETSFFRHQPSFAALRKLLEQRKTPGAPCELWSAGCSTGEEAYSLAMTAAVLAGASAHVTGTDLNRRVLAAAKAGVFATRQITGVPQAWRGRFLAEASRTGYWQVTAPLRAQVSFEPFHLLDSRTYPARQFDVIFCCNVLIYFTLAARQDAVKGLLARLRPGGHLFVAPGETSGLTMTGAEPIRLEGTHVWRRAS